MNSVPSIFRFHRHLHPGTIGFGPVLEEGLIIGFSILAILIVISIVLSVLNWSQGMVNNLIKSLGG